MVSQSVLRAKMADKVHKFATNKEAAKHYGMTASHLGEVLAGSRNITDDVARKFGWKQHEMFFLEDK